MIKDEKKYRILVIEDNDGDFALVEEMLAEQISEPHTVHAPNFKRAAILLQAANQPFDIILLDLTLPDKSGQRLISEMLQMAPLCPVIVLTGFANIDFSIDSISQGISDYLIKDELTPTSLYKSILYSLERKRITSELEQSNKRYSDLFHLSPMPMWLYDTESFRFLQVNKASIKQYGYTEAEFLNMSIADILATDEHDFNGFQVNALIPAEINVQKVYHRKKGGEVIDAEVSTTQIMVNEKKCQFVIVNDVTEKNFFELNLTKAIIKTQEDERYEIGGELHDNVCQILATSQLSLGMLKTSLLPGTEHWFNQCREYIILASEEIRNLSHRLAPAFFDDTTMEEALHRLLETCNTEGKFTYRLSFSRAAKNYPINRDLQLNLYRIVQEQLRNILKYAEASSIEIGLDIDKGWLNIYIADDGRGFDPATAKNGIGMANMQRRAALFFGEMEVVSAVGNGCKLIIRIPLK